MDENTKCIVASNLTIAYFGYQASPSAQPDARKRDLEAWTKKGNVEPVLSIYGKILKALASQLQWPESPSTAGR